MKKIKKFFMFLCILILFFGISGCPHKDDQPTFSSTPNPGIPSTPPEPAPPPVPKPTTLLLLGSGLIVIAGIRRKFKK